MGLPLSRKLTSVRKLILTLTGQTSGFREPQTHCRAQRGTRHKGLGTRILVEGYL